MGDTDIALQLTIEALDKFSGTMSKLTAQMAGVAKQGTTATDQSKKQTSVTNVLKGSWTELSSALGVAKMAYGQLQKVVKELVGDTVEYAQQVRDMGRVTGQTAEATSTLIQAADDAEVSVGSLERAMRMAVRKGFLPTIENLAALSDQYNALSDPMEKNRLLMSKFGRSAFEMAKFMEQGSAAIKESATQAQAFGLILSEEQVKAAREYEKAIDNLGDAFSGLKYTIGNAVIPVLTAAAEAFVTLMSATAQVNALLGVHNKEVAKSASTYQEYTTEIKRAALASGYQVDAEGKLVKVTGERRGRVVELIDADYQLTETEWGLTRAIDAQNEKNAAANAIIHAQVDTVALLEHAQKRAGEEAQAAADAMNSAWASLDMSPLDALADIAKKIAWRDVGGDVLANFVTQLEDAAKAGVDISSELTFAKEAAIALQLAAGQIDLREAKRQAADLGIPWKDIEKLTGMSNEHLQAMILANGQTVSMKVNILEVTTKQTVFGGNARAMEFGGKAREGTFEVGEAGSEGMIVGPGGVEIIPHSRWVQMRRRMMGNVPQLGSGFAFDPDTLRQAGYKNPEYSTFTQQSIATKQIVQGAQGGGGGGGGGGTTITAAASSSAVEAVTSGIISAVAEVVRAATPSTTELTAAVLAPAQAAAAQSAQASAELLEEIRKMVRILQAQGTAGDTGAAVRTALQFASIGG